jgi:hypothetical protein
VFFFIVLEQTVIAEANLIQFVNTARLNKSTQYLTDVPGRISMEDRLDPEQLITIQEQLRAIVEMPDVTSANEIQKEVKAKELR